MRVLLFILLIFFLFPTLCFGVEDYNFYIDITSEGKSEVKLLIKFSEPVEKFSLSVFGKIENFSVESDAGPQNCSLKVGEISLINCNLSLTPEKKTLKIGFETRDFVKKVDNEFYFVADLSLGESINHSYGVAKLPIGAILSEKKEILPSYGKITTDGRRIMIVWREENLPPQFPLKIQFVYELIASSVYILQPWQFVLVAVIAALLPTYLVLRRGKKPEKIILSVLDPFERKVIEAIISEGGRVNQKKIVQKTGLSKAKVSRVVKSLAKKKLITVERFGRTNILKLKKKFLV
jgi:hypothetical protein